MEAKTRKKCDLCGIDQSFFKLLYNLDNFRVVKCKKCGLIFRDIILSSEESNQLYSSGYFTKEQKNFFFDNNSFKINDFINRITEIEKIYKKRGRLLDVGCALGTFLDICQKRGWQVFGEEISDYAVSYAKNYFGLDVFQGELTKAGFPDNYFDVITLWDVIEHSEFPSLLVKEAHRILKKDGLIAVQTTMEDSLMFKLAHYIYLFSRGLVKSPVQKGHPIHHSTFFSPKTIGLILEKSGFKVVKKKRFNLPKQLISVRRGILSKFAFDTIYFIGGLIKRPLDAVIYARK